MADSSKPDGTVEAADSSAAPAEGAFKPCLELAQQGQVDAALTLVQQLIYQGSFPERPQGDAILLVSTCCSSVCSE